MINNFKNHTVLLIKKIILLMIKFSNDKIPELSNTDELIFEKNLVWLFGSARGGTTWVALNLVSFKTNSINDKVF